MVGVLVVIFIRFYKITVSPGYEWDEPVYAQIAARTTVVGFPQDKTDGDTYDTNTYLYHPPFDFYLKGAWFTITGSTTPDDEIGAGRILAGIESLAGLIIAFLCLLDISGPATAIIGLILLSTDGWLIYTARLNLIENAMMPIGMLGIWLYFKATKTNFSTYYLLSGLLLGFAAVYKHTGIPFLIAPMINFAITRHDKQNHKLLFGTMAAVILTYIVAMTIIWKGVYISETWVQVERVMGIFHSRGLNYGLGEMFAAVYRTYWVFVCTVASIIIVGVVGGIRLIQAAVFRQRLFNSVLLSWTIAAFLFLAVIALKAPQYLIILLIPGYMFMASELGHFNWNTEPMKRIVVTGIVGIALIVNMYTWVVRFAIPTDNALKETYSFFQTVPIDARVLDDDCVSFGISQPSYNIDRFSTDQEIQEAAPNYVVVYSTLTQKLPTSQALQNLIARSILVERFTGFKEIVEIYKVP